MDTQAFNQTAWDEEVSRGNQWTVPVTPEAIEAARQGRWRIVLTPTKPIPDQWIPDLPGLDVLCLASGGGQQGPILAAAGANVTVLDNSPRQLGQDRTVAERESLTLTTVQGDMARLDMFSEGQFDLIVHPCSNCFVEDILPVWREAFRVLRPQGTLLAGICNPVEFLFDEHPRPGEELTVRHAIPFADTRDLSESELRDKIARKEPLTFAHTLTDQIGGQLDAGFVITGFYEDTMPDSPLSDYIPTCIATRAVKP